MQLTIKINLDNAAFEDEYEIKRILNNLSTIFIMQRIPKLGKFPLRDINGNDVGDAEITN